MESSLCRRNVPCGFDKLEAEWVWDELFLVRKLPGHVTGDIVLEAHFRGFCMDTRGSAQVGGGRWANCGSYSWKPWEWCQLSPLCLLTYMSMCTLGHCREFPHWMPTGPVGSMHSGSVQDLPHPLCTLGCPREYACWNLLVLVAAEVSSCTCVSPQPCTLYTAPENCCNDTCYVPLVASVRPCTCSPAA